MSLSRQEMTAGIAAILDGKMPDEGAVRLLQRIEDEGATPAEIAGAVDAMMNRVVAFPSYPDAVDVCGTGGDYQHTLNISTTVAFVVAACGVKVVKHGNKAVTSQSGSADVLQALGVKTNLSPEKTIKVMEEVGMCFLFAPAFHPGLGQIAPLRKALGRTIFNVVGPLCNPAKVDRQLIGVYEKRLCDPVAKACKLLGRKHVMVVHGADGADELSISGDSFVAEVRGDEITTYDIQPKRAGLPIHPIEGIKGGSARDNAAEMRALFEGALDTAYSDAVIYNAAAALVVSGKASALRGGAQMALEAIATGEAKNKLEQFVAATQIQAAQTMLLDDDAQPPAEGEAAPPAADAAKA